ncbi:MAG: GH25 family lysozyme [Ruminococcus sp.]|nr:GH25 family lysozyme [Oscillospiraceae bacterium]
MLNIKRIICVVLGGFMTAAACGASLYFSKAVVNRETYPVMGVDVSRYQGEISWQQLESQGVSFAFIKATEGSGHVDAYARQNLENADCSDIPVSAYHFFSFDSPGESQAKNYISAVSRESIDLPPVVDIEYYGDKRKNKPSQAECSAILKPLLDRLEEFYGVKPIIYTTLEAYIRYIKDDFGDYPLWIRSVSFEPEFIDWDFWQYSCTGELYGFIGEEKYIDLNVFNGTMDEFAARFGIR